MARHTLQDRPRYALLAVTSITPMGGGEYRQDETWRVVSTHDGRTIREWWDQGCAQAHCRQLNELWRKEGAA